MGSVKSDVASGNPLINGLLYGVSWDAKVTYSISNSTADYPDNYMVSALDGIRPMTDAQTVAIYLALDADMVSEPASGFTVEGFTNLNVMGAETGQIRAGSSSTENLAFAFYPSYSGYGGDVWFGNSGDRPAVGNYDYHTVLHEIGHAVGLKHGQDGLAYDPDSIPQLNTALPSQYDSMEYSVMTYRSYVGQDIGGYTNETWGFAQTFMMADIAALQYLYGADYTANAGDTIYVWRPDSGNTWINGEVAISPGANKIFLTIWDGDGNDTYDLSAYSNDLDVDLSPGGTSELGSNQLAWLGGGNDDNGSDASGSVYNALMHGNDTRCLIENVICGSGDDLVRGNQADNIVKGGLGIDTLVFDGNRDDYDIYSKHGVLTVVDQRGLDGTDTAESIELFRFADGDHSADHFLNGVTGSERGEYLAGTDNDDVIWSKGGRFDRMYGGDGADRFVIGWETSNGSTEREIIYDYEVGSDQIALMDGASVSHFSKTSSFLVAHFAGDGDLLFIGGDAVDPDHLTFTAADGLLLA